LRVEIVPRFNGAPLVFDAPTNAIAGGRNISVTRLDFLLSAIALRQTNGTWIEQKNWFAYIDARDGRTSFTLGKIPAGSYDRIRFHIGLEPAVNHGDAAQWPAGHPLNPTVNHLYWGWSREYVFLALEGRWHNTLERQPPARHDLPTANSHPYAVPEAGAPFGTDSGFSYHLATDRQLMTVALPAALDLRSDQELRVALDVGKIFAGPNRIELSDTSDTTHSRTNDVLAGELRENIEAAFAVISSEGRVTRAPDPRPQGNLGLAEFAPPKTYRIEMASTATPYRLTFSAYAPQPDLPRDNPLTVEGVALGGRLFFDRRLSANNSESCARCHNPHLAFAQPSRVSRGADGVLGTRNAMPLENLAWKNSFFWDGRAATLREQVLQPIQNPIEMHETLPHVVAKISGDADYHQLFTRAFGSPDITADRIARALEQFLLAQVSFDSKFDQVMKGTAKFTDEEQRGFILFNTEYDPYHGQHGADCFHCHGGPLFQSQDFANNGLDSIFTDSGRYNVTRRPGDDGKFAVPSLRNVAVTAPYMHDGRFRTLDEAVEHYCTGMKRSATLDPNLAKHPDGGVPLSAADQHALVAFLKTLTDRRFLSPADPANPVRTPNPRRPL